MAKPKKRSSKPGAMGTDPKKTSKLPETSRRGNWKYNGKWVNKDGYKVDNYGKVLPGQNKPFVPAKNNPFAPKQTTPQTPAAPPTDPYTGQPGSPWDQASEADRNAWLNRDMGEVMRQTMGNAKALDPGSFQQQMDAARQNVMKQFELQNADAFKQQEAAFYQRAAEQGMDPNNPGYATLYKQEVTDRQDRARQQAMLAAEEAAQGVAKQGFEQNYQTFLAPGVQFGQFAPVWGDMYKTGIQAGLTREELQNRMDIAKMQEQGALQRARITGGGGGQTDPTLFDQWRAQNIGSGYNKPNVTSPGNAAISGGAAGGGNAVVDRLKGPNRQG
ncbi:MAG: hypothetical protein EBR82_19260 [Caulobacteraceae bacterium]|nr:hypothetical protein [Caulobacteraceae bacterium]